VQRSLGIPKEYVFTDLEEAPELLELILDTQQQKIDEADGAHEVPQYAVIFDDVIGDKRFMNDKAFTRCFYQVRHVNCTTFICTQHFKRVPRICRLQANFVFFFQGSQTEVETVAEEFAPPNISKRDFMHFVSETSKEKFSFLTINMKVDQSIRFRKNLDLIASLGSMEKKNYVDANKENIPPHDGANEQDSGRLDDKSSREAGERTDGKIVRKRRGNRNW
jgi:hypothetical protein